MGTQGRGEPLMDEKVRNVPGFERNITSPGRGTIYVASRFVADAEAAFSPGAVAVENGVVVAAGAPDDVEREVPAGFDRVDLPGLADRKSTRLNSSHGYISY